MSSSQALFGDDSEGEEDELRVEIPDLCQGLSESQTAENWQFQDNEDDDSSSALQDEVKWKLLNRPWMSLFSRRFMP